MGDESFLLLDQLRRSGQKALLATVVRATGPSYRKPGASAVIVADGRVLGAVSGGCLESDLLENARTIFAGGPPRLLDYDSGDDADLMWGTGTGCGGRVEILLAPVPDQVLDDVVATLERGEPALVSSVIAPGPELGHRTVHVPVPGAGAWWYAHEGHAFQQIVSPPTPFLLCGAGNDCEPVVRLAASAGFQVTVVDHRADRATPERFPAAHRVELAEPEELAGRLRPPAGSLAVIMSHHFERDLRYLEVLLDQPLSAVGLLGARERSHRLVKELLDRRPDLAEAASTRLRAPVGLDIGADGPQEIAIAIVAELVGIRAGRAGAPLWTGAPGAPVEAG